MTKNFGDEDAKENDDDEADYTKGGGGGGCDPAAEGGNNEYDKDDNEEDVMDFLSPLVARRVERLKCLNTEREKVMEQYMQEIAALETKY